MDKKSKIILVLLVITLLSLSSYASLSRFSKGINKEGSINTTELSYCGLNEIETLSECLIRNDSKQELSLALNTIDDRTNNASDQSGLYKNEDDYTINDSNYTYYYRGNVDNNWVKFGDYLWRIVRINGNGTIRMIYSGLIDAPNHTGSNAQIGISAFGDDKKYNVDVLDLYNPLMNVTITYSNGRFDATNVGYMYNPVKVFKTRPDKELNSTYDLNKFPLFMDISNNKNYYFFKNFNSDMDCFSKNNTTDSSACSLKCRKLGDDGEDDVDCVYSNWNTLATTEGNYSTIAPGVYPETNPTQYVYQKSNDDGGYRYTCWNYGTTVKKNNDDGTASVYVTCPVVSEIVGTVKDQATQAKVRYHGYFSQNTEVARNNVLDSKIKSVVETWYHDNIYNMSDENNNYLEDYISDGIFCNDRSSTSDDSLLENGYHYYFKPYDRNIDTNRNPSFKCLNTDGTFNTNDAFTLAVDTSSIVAASEIGNNKLNYPVGLITVDEVTFAKSNGNYLNTNHIYWTMSPYTFNSAYTQAYIWLVSSDGDLAAANSANILGVRPVINLKSDILYKGGNGTESNPYIIDINN